jgi:hypothetical protein
LIRTTQRTELRGEGDRKFSFARTFGSLWLSRARHTCIKDKSLLFQFHFSTANQFISYSIHCHNQHHTKMSFWKTFGFHTASAIETILDRGDYTLDELLDEEEMLQECKAQNKRLLDFLTEPDQLKRLFEYITQEPEEQDPKRKFKYPYISCEILVAGIEPILEAVFKNSELIERLFKFLDSKPPLNPLLASYVSRVTMALLEKRPKEVVDLMKKQKDMIGKFLAHLGTTTVMDMLLRIIAAEDIEGGILQWLREGNLIRSLIDKFDPSLDSDVHEHAAQTLADIIGASANKNTPLMDDLESEETLRRLFHFILNEKSKSSLIYGLTVVIELLRRNSKATHDSIAKITDLSPVFRVTVEYLPQLTKLLTVTNTEKMSTTVGEIEPFGAHRLRILEFLLALAQTNYQCIDTALMNLDVFSRCLDVFFRFPWNNFVHATVEKLIETVFIHENEGLKLSLLVQCKLIDRLMEAYKDAQEDRLKSKGVQKGYVGHLAKIVAFIFEHAKTDNISQILSSHKDWNEFAPKIVEELKLVETKPLGGERPSNPGVNMSLNTAALMGSFSGLLKTLSGMSPESHFVSTRQEGDDATNTENSLGNYNEDEDDSDDEDNTNELDFSFPDDYGAKESKEKEENETKETSPELIFQNSDAMDAEAVFDSVFNSAPNDGSDEEEDTDVRIIEWSSNSTVANSEPHPNGTNEVEQNAVGSTMNHESAPSTMNVDTKSSSTELSTKKSAGAEDSLPDPKNTPSDKMETSVSS